MSKSAEEIRSLYLSFMVERGHSIIPSSSLVPQNDPTTLFTGSGMQPLVPYLLGKEHPHGSRLVNSQKCFRSMDIEEVGDNRHTTFFEMLGNWSLGDYFKSEQLEWIFEFLTGGVGLNPQKLYVTAFIGDSANNVPKDEMSVALWKALFLKKGIEASDVEIGSEENGYTVGMQGGRIFYYDAKKNWWSRSGTPDKMPSGEPGGPDSEIFYDFGSAENAKGGHAAVGDDIKWGAECHPNCDCGRFLEIGNSVFMQYIKNPDGTFALLPKQNVDFGGGLERVAAASNENSDVFKVDVFATAISEIERLSGKKYDDSKWTHAFRVILDHMRASIFLIADGVLPMNSDQGYFVRRLLRRSVRFADKLELPEKSLGKLAILFVTEYKESYQELFQNVDIIESTINDEETKFRITLHKGLEIFDKWHKSYAGPRLTDAERSAYLESAPKELLPQDVFELITSHGFPRELIIEEAVSRGVFIDWLAVDGLIQTHKLTSRSGSEQKFKGGLADASEATTRLHTAHHLLLKALQTVLGEHVHQRGSNITGERLRIDFSHGEKMTDEQKKEVERIVNEKIAENLPVITSTMALEEAEKLQAEHEFGAKYPEQVTVYSIGPTHATLGSAHFENAYSIEFCGGPHVQNTKELALAGTFKIQKEEASSQGVRRIKAVLS